MKTNLTLRRQKKKRLSEKDEKTTHQETPPKLKEPEANLDTVNKTQENVNPHVGSLFSDFQDGLEEALEHEEGKETSVVMHEVEIDPDSVIVDDLKPYGQDENKEQLFDALWELGNKKEGFDGVSIEEFAEAHHRTQKKNLKSSAESNRKTINEIAQLEDSDPEWIKYKKLWKQQNPDRTLKEYKDAYVREKINHLPWDPYHFAYRQNDEQNENSIWSKIRDGNSSSNTT